MSKIEQLIQQYCPDGVEYKPIGDIMYVSDYVSAGSFASIRDNVQYMSEPSFAVLLRFADYSSGFNPAKFVYVNEKAYNYLKKSNLEPGDIIMSNVGSCGSLFACPNLGMPMTLAPNSIVIKAPNNRFYFHWLSSQAAQNEITRIKSKSAMPKFNKTEFKKILAPCPPPQIQEEIVKILDTFSELQAKLQTELQTELQSRQQQYQYYRDKLLSFEGRDDVEWRTLEEVTIEIFSGATPSKTRKDFWENGTIPWMSSGEVNLGQVYDVTGRITQLGYDKCSTKMVPAGSLVIALAGQGKTRGTVAILRKSVCTNQSLAALVPDTDIVSGDYLFHYLRTQYSKLRDVSAGDGTRGGLNLKMIKSYRVLIPPKEEQSRIVNILYRLDTLVNDHSQNLSAEMEARKQQYEYYRDKLLTFKRK